MARSVFWSVWLFRGNWHRSYEPSALDVLRVTLAHRVSEVVFPPKDLTSVDLQADKTDVVQSVIPVCRTMS